jgi:hypothetical protein
MKTLTIKWKDGWLFAGSWGKSKNNIKVETQTAYTKSERVVRKDKSKQQGGLRRTKKRVEMINTCQSDLNTRRHHPLLLTSPTLPLSDSWVFVCSPLMSFVIRSWELKRYLEFQVTARVEKRNTSWRSKPIESSQSNNFTVSFENIQFYTSISIQTEMNCFYGTLYEKTFEGIWTFYIRYEGHEFYENSFCFKITQEKHHK